VSTHMKVEAVPFGQFRDEILKSYESKNQDTLNNMRRALESLAGLGVATTADLTPELLDRLVSSLQGKTTEKSISRRLWLVNRICNLAIERGVLEVSPFLRRPGLHREMMEVAAPSIRMPGPSPAKVKQVLAELARRAESNNLAYRLYAIAATVGYTGLLPFTVGTIRVEDVDFENGVIRVHRNDGTSKQGGARRRPRVVPMPEELTTILKDWILSRGHHVGRLLDEKKVAEARKLRADGWSLEALCARYGVKHTAMFNAVTGRTWKHVPADGEIPSAVADSEWLFPNLNPSGHARADGPSKMNARDAMSYQMLKEAGRAAGIENLTFMHLQSFHRDYIRPRVLLNLSHMAVRVCTIRGTIGV
jgi:integrase